MNSEQIIIPRLETVLKIEGKNSKNKIHNIGFENLTFSHTMSQYAYKYGNATCQAWLDFSYVMDREYAYPQLNSGCSIRTKHTENLRFRNNNVCQSNSTGLLMYDGTYYADVSGNCFYDLGSGAMIIGSGGGPAKDYEAENGLTNVALGKPVSVGSTATLQIRSNPVSAVEPSHNAGYAIAPNDWFQVDLEDKYKIDEVQYLSGSGKGYEIYVSNDENFSEYEVLTTAKKTKPEYQDFTGYPDQPGYSYYLAKAKFGDPQKYRYVRLKNVSSSTIGITHFQVFTSDLDGAKNWDLVYDCNVSNNYITRTCRELWMQCAVTIILTDSLKFLHNEIIGVPYTGINLGANHHLISYSVAKDNIIGYNKVVNASQKVQDGGPIYTSGPQKGTKNIGNYFKGQVFGMAALYPDQGSSY